MVKAKLITTFLAICAVISACGPGYDWTKIEVNGKYTGVKASGASNIRRTMGKIDGKDYIAPSGRVFDSQTGYCVYQEASIMLEAQPYMSELKRTIAYAPKEMKRSRPECELTNWAVDVLMDSLQNLVGRKVDLGLINYGGVRGDIYRGDVTYDDIMSIFPFKNCIVYCEIKGSEVRKLFEKMAADRVEVIGGARITIKDGRLQYAEVGNEVLDDDKIYGLATIDFLLTGGDGFFLKDMSEKIIRTNVLLSGVMVGKLEQLTAAGKQFKYKTDKRITVKLK